MLLSATPTPPVISEAKKVLGLDQVELIQMNLDRPEIFLDVKKVVSSFRLFNPSRLLLLLQGLKIGGQPQPSS